MTRFEIPTSGKIGGSVPFSITVRNQGAVAADPFRVEFSFAMKPSNSVEALKSSTFCRWDNGLAAGQQGNCQGEMNIPDVPGSGNYEVTAVVDSRFQVDETNETNNVRSSDNGLISLSSVDGSLDLTGTWSGDAFDSTGPGRMTWRLNQNGNAVTGSVTGQSILTSATFNGSFSGTLSAVTLTFSINIPKGGISSFPDCSIMIDGTAFGVTNNSASGTYTGQNSCTGPILNGSFTLSKQ